MMAVIPDSSAFVCPPPLESVIAGLCPRHLGGQVHCESSLSAVGVSCLICFPQQNKAPKRHDGDISFRRETSVSVFKSLVRTYGFQDCWILGLCSGAGNAPIWVFTKNFIWWVRYLFKCLLRFIRNFVTHIIACAQLYAGKPGPFPVP